MRSQTPLLDTVRAQYEKVSAPFPWQRSAWGRFLARGLPEKTEEAFRPFNLSALYGAPLQESPPTPSLEKEEILRFVADECRHSYVAFVDGKLRLDLSSIPSSIQVIPLPEALKTFGHFLHSRLAKAAQEEQDPFALLNHALSTEGAFLYIPPKIKPPPVQCLQIATHKNSCLHTRLHLVLAREAELTFVNTKVDLASNAFYSSLCDIALEEGARCCYLSATASPTETCHFDAIRATLKRDAHLKAVSWTTGDRIHSQDIAARLLGEGAEIDLQGLWMLQKKAHAHTRVLIDHQVPHARSFQRFKGALTGTSRSSFSGKILVAKEAQKTESYQLNNNLILSKGAIAYSMPNLEIFADDVKASHGSTVAQLPLPQLFYLRTRGIKEKEARALLISGFCREILEQILLPSIRAHAERALQAFSGEET